MFSGVGRLGLRAVFGGPSFSVLSLFANGEQGVWYQNSDFSTLFQDAAGTTPVTALEQPVGLRLDKSKGLVLGSEIAGGTPAAYTANGTVSVSGGTVTCTCTTNGNYGLSFGAVATANTRYFMTFEVVTNSAPRTIYGWAGNASADAINAGTTTGVKTGRLLMTGGSTAIAVLGGAAGESFSVRNISVRELPGNHAFQTTNSARPVLSARYNLLTYSEQFDNAYWAKVALNTTGTPAWVNVAVAPDGTTTAEKLIPSVASSSHSFGSTAQSLTAGLYTASVYAKAAELSVIQIFVATAASTQFANFDVLNGTVSAGTYDAASITSVGNGWYRCSVTMTFAATSTIMYIAAQSSPTAVRNAAFLGNASDGILIWGADLRAASESPALPAYQRVGAATYGTSTVAGNPDYDAVGFPPYLIYDGGDWFQTSSINFTATDKMSVFAGVRKLSDASRGILVELSTSYGNVGSFGLEAPSGNLINNYQFVAGGSIPATAVAVADGIGAPVTNIITGLDDISGDSVIIRADAVQRGSSNANQGTGNFGNYPLYFGARAGTSNFFQGRDYGFVIVGRAVTASELTNTEDYMDVQTFGKNMTLVYSDELTTALGELITAADGDQIYMSVSYV